MDEKVFKSTITRVQTNTDDLYSLLKINPAVPITKNTNTEDSSIAFEPQRDKYFIPKKKSKLKVQTVRDIRNTFEQDIYESLPIELEKQESLLLRKIKSGHLKNESTKNLAKSILKLNKPISRSSWQILTNINPENNAHRQQYVLWNGTYIRINGSRGGGTKFLHKTDLYNNVAGLSKSKTVKPVHMRENKKKNLLETSVNIKFKPGPLSRKFHLDCSYQKHQVGKTELVSLPSPVLEVYPSNGHALDSTITNYLHNMRDLDGSVSQTWAELAASAVGSVKNGKLRKLSPDVIKFELNYKNGQGRILMRNNGTDREDNDFDKLTNSIEIDTETEVKNMLNEIITSVEVSLKQDHFCIDDEPRSVSELDINLNTGGETMKDKAKKKYCELDRLDVTVIRLSDQGAEDATKICKKSFCNLGCICSSLECCNYVKGHCRRIECMFECKCDFSKFAHYEKFPKILFQILNLDREISGKLAKEEQKFHQTVVMTGDKSIVLKGESRNLKIPQKYADFYKNMCLKNKIPSTRSLSVVSLKLNSQNVEPWCMVHNLYKCFCKGKFIESNFGTENIPTFQVKQDSLKTFDALNTEEKYNTRSENEFNKRIHKTSSHGDYRDTPTDNESNNPCSRVLPYSKRKYNLDYYKKLSRKIVHMESNDIKLQKRLAELSSKNRHSSENTQTDLIRVPTSTVSEESIDVVKQCQTNENHQHNLQKRSNDASKLSSILIDDNDSDSSSSAIQQSKKIEESEKWEPKNKTLVKWLENSYKKYKKEIELGIEKTSLDPPKAGTMTLYPWDFILNRYRGRKNLFLVSKSPPYRIFIAVNIKHPLFENCINIDEIRYADLHKYPNTVKNLLSNANDLTNHFFIFRGLKHCWELVGSVSKVDDKSKESDIQIAENELPKLSLDIDDGDSCNDVLAVSNFTNTAVLKQDMQQDSEIKKQNNVADSSKWFVMTIANDFSEIQFYKKGFFVKYESIIKAINVSRSSGNTVRLSSVQQSDPNSTPHFGIYAIPRVNEYCVFIGPYEKDEPLGIEIIKTYSDTLKTKRTRGVWITTKKVDNFNVIDNPLDYMPNLNKALQEEVQIDSADQDLHSEPEPGAHSDADIPDATSSTNTSNKEKKLTRIVIRKTNGFFKILPQAKAKQADAKRLEACENPDEVSNQLMEIPKTSEFSNICIKGNQITKRPIAEIAPQVKESKNKFARMSILKPEEINKKVLEKAHISKKTEEIENDIENFLATSVVCAPPATLAAESFSEVFLECKTVKDLGYIKGKLQNDKFLSFQFPGFKFSPYYEKDEAIEKINQVLSRKVYVPKHINLEWKIATSQDELICKTILNPEELGSDMVLTTGGLLHKKHLLNSKLTDIFDDDVEINANLEISSEDEVST